MSSIQVDDDITLYEITMSDSNDLFTAINSNKEFLSEHLDFVKYADSIEFVEHYIEGITSNPCTSIFVIRKNGNFVGLIGIQQMDFQNNSCEIGYWLIPSFAHQGIMSKCQARFLDLCFLERHINRVEVRVEVENIVSIKCCEKGGFIKEGIERQRMRIDGKYHDVQVLSILSSEYKSRL